MKFYPTKDPSIPDPRTVSLTLSAIIEIFDIPEENKAQDALEKVILDFYEDCNLAINDSFFQNLDGAFALMRTLAPKNDTEKVDCAMVVLSQMLGAHKMSQHSQKDREIGLRFLEQSSLAMQRLHLNRVSK